MRTLALSVLLAGTALAADHPEGFALTSPADAATRGAEVVMAVTAPAGVADVWVVLADEDSAPICPKALAGECLDITGGWLAFGPLPVTDGVAKLAAALPASFSGNLLRGQALTRVDGALWLSAPLSWKVPGRPRGEAGPVNEGVREAILAGLAPAAP